MENENDSDDEEYDEVYYLSADCEILYRTDNSDLEVEPVESGFEAEGNDTERIQLEDPPIPKPRGRKRKYGMTREARKLMCNMNKPYINTKGVEVPPKEFDEHFKCTCKKKCTEVVTLEDRKRLFDEFWNIGSFPARCLLLQQHIKEFPKKRSYTKNDSRRQHSRKYYIKDVEICKTAFLKTLQIHSNRVDVALQKRNDTVIKDRRGLKSGGWNRCSQEQIDGVIKHINNFLVYISQLRKKQTEPRAFQNSELNLKRMYNEYKESCKTVVPVSHSTYKLIFYRKFHRRVKTPHKLMGKCNKDHCDGRKEQMETTLPEC